MDIRARLRKEPGLSLYAALVAVQVFFGIHYLAAKVVLREIPPPAWATIRVAASAAILLAWAAWTGKLPRGRREIGELALYAIFGVVINQICFIEGLSVESAQTLTTSPDDGGRAVMFELAQNYPNPFNPTTVIRFELPEAGDVKLAVYDVLGRQVAVLVDERRAAGMHHVSFDGGGLSSGLYIYRLTAGENAASRRMILAR